MAPGSVRTDQVAPSILQVRSACCLFCGHLLEWGMAAVVDAARLLASLEGLGWVGGRLRVGVGLLLVLVCLILLLLLVLRFRRLVAHGTPPVVRVRKAKIDRGPTISPSIVMCCRQNDLAAALRAAASEFDQVSRHVNRVHSHPFAPTSPCDPSLDCDVDIDECYRSRNLGVRTHSHIVRRPPRCRTTVTGIWTEHVFVTPHPRLYCGPQSPLPRSGWLRVSSHKV